MQQNVRFIGEILKRAGTIDPEAIDEIVSTLEREGRGAKLPDALVRSGKSDEETIAQALGEGFGLRVQLEVANDKIPREMLTERAFDFGFARSHQMLPLYFAGDMLVVGVADPLDTWGLDDLRERMGFELEPVVVPATKLMDALSWTQTQIERAGHLQDDGQNSEPDEIRQEILESDDDAQIIRWVNSLFVEALKDRATDIHVQPDDNQVTVRFRVDGDLREVRTTPRRFLPAIVARIKVLSGLNIAEKRLPQDGRYGFKMGGKNVDIRVSTIPIGNDRGERVVMRILNKSSIQLSLTDLGFAPDRLALMYSLIEQPHGIVLVTGPTGSGKTTTLYACLNRINRADLNILTAEDPIEYDLRGISQMQVNSKIGLTFASCLRAFLRQDPDVIMVGEIRDKETAEIAVQASLTGHLVLSTIHTNDSAGALPRLAEMGIESFHIASTLQAALAQRLVRVLCSHCKERHMTSEQDWARLGLDRSRALTRVTKAPTKYGSSAFGGSPAGHLLQDLAEGRRVPAYRAVGCPKCQGTGFMGRTGIYELLLVTDAVRGLTLKSADSVTIRRAGIEEGMDTLRDDGARKVLEGITTIEEVLAATQDEH
ncbi:MAG: Flp pilus assembly complex ATPase component TadA [Myxococcales bacterium]|nr:Flp pilus assembly complex ATPase component TadA [Myxococcales bacterium]